MKIADKYLKVVEWSEEDGCYVGRCPELMLGGVHGKDQAKVYRELCEVVEDWIRISKEDGTPLPEPGQRREYSGKFVLRVGKDLHERLALKAMTSGNSLNNYCKKILQQTT